MEYSKKSLLTCLFIVLGTIVFGQTGTIHLSIKNIEKTGGELVIGVFDNEVSFKSKTNPTRVSRVIVTGDSAAHTFIDLHFTDYAVAVYHDENKDGELNTKSMKIPTEGVGASGRITKLRAPKFEDTSFSLTKDTTIVIQMMYPGNR